MSEAMSKAFTLVSAAAVAAAVGLWQRSPRGPEAPAPRAPSSHQDARSAPLLAAELSDVQSQIDALADNQEALQDQLDDAAETTQAPPPVDPAAANERQAQEQIATLSERFSAEAVDPSWASDAERALQVALDDDALPGLSVRSATCHASMCLLDLEFSDVDARVDGMPDIPFYLPWNAEAFFSIDPEAEASATIYVAREGETLPRAL